MVESRKASVTSPNRYLAVTQILLYVSSGCKSAGILQQDLTDSKNPPLPFQPLLLNPQIREIPGRNRKRALWTDLTEFIHDIIFLSSYHFQSNANIKLEKHSEGTNYLSTSCDFHLENSIYIQALVTQGYKKTGCFMIIHSWRLILAYGPWKNKSESPSGIWTIT